MSVFFSRLQRLFSTALAALLVVPCMGLEEPAVAQTTPIQKQVLKDLKGEDGEGRDGAFANLGSDLAQLYRRHQRFQKSKNAGKAFAPKNSTLPVQDETVVVDFLAQGGEGAVLKKNLRALGAENLAQSGRLVSGRLPISALSKVAELPSLHSAEPAYMVAASGSVTSQGDEAMNADDARSGGGPDGGGVKVGVLSDTYDQAENAATTAQDDINSGDLPPSNRIDILDDISSLRSNSDEGRAMMQIIHDVAPGADLAFHTAVGGRANFAEGIRDLADAGSGVITDDIIYRSEPMFQNGPIADAVEHVANEDGVAYFSAVGNDARQSYTADGLSESDFIGTGGPNGGSLLDFDGNGDTTQEVSIPSGETVTFTLQWADPYASASVPGNEADTDLNIFLKDQSGDIVERSETPNVGGDPVEILSFQNTTGDGSFNLQIECTDGCSASVIPQRLTYVYGNPQVTINEHQNPGPTSYGHTNAENSHSVAAAGYFDTPEFDTNPPQARSFSSEGGIPIYFDDDGNPLASPVTLEVPAITGPDEGNTTFFGRDIGIDTDTHPNFPGTSAAAPHVAAVAALMRSKDPTLSPSQIYTELENEAIEMNDPGYDHLTGYGFVDANATIDNLTDSGKPSPPTGLKAGAEQGVVILTWDSNTESDMSGGSYEIHRSTTSGFTPGSGTRITTEPHSGDGERYEDASGLASETTYYYKVLAVDENNDTSPVLGFGEAVVTLPPSTVTTAVNRSYDADAFETEDYRLVALPGKVDEPIDQSLDGTPENDWRAYLDDGSGLVVYEEGQNENRFRFQKGNGFWLINTQNWTHSGTGIPTADLTNGTTEIPKGTLNDGWNIISNPFDRNVDWRAVQTTNEGVGPFQPIFKFDGTFTQVETFKSAKEGKAYYFFNREGLNTLEIPYPSGKSSAKKAKGDKRNTLALSARPVGRDGPSSTVQMGITGDTGAIVAPPSRFEAVSLRIRPTASTVSTNASSDRTTSLMAQYRQMSGTGETFELRLSSQTGEAVELTAENLDAVTGQSVALLPSSTATLHDLRTEGSVTVDPGEEGMDLKVLVGSRSYVRNQTDETAPTDLTLNSYPNPVREQATIEYGLPKSAGVQLVLYDMLGRRVQTIARGNKQAGRHVVNLEASTLTSGVYFARLKAQGVTRTRKIVVVK
jgi:hypothetical protein